MNKIEACHYTDTLIYSIDRVLKNIKADLNQYIQSLDNITAEQFAVLDTICSSETICQQDTARILSKDKSNIKRIIEILEKNNYVKRIIGKKGNRLVNFLEATPEGKEIIDKNIGKIKSYMQNVFKNITDDEIKTLWNIVYKLEKFN